MINNWLKINQKLNLSRFLRFSFKQNCLMCAASTSELSLCERCIDSLNLAPSPSCPQCGLTTQGEHCGQCLKSTPAYDTTKALFSYTFPTSAILQHYKYNNALFLSQTFGALFSEQIATNNQYKEIDLIIAMPLHADRIKERGFNQSLEIAKTMAKQLSIPLDKTSCMRIKNTAPQASLPLKARLKNMRGAFQINMRDNIKGKRIAIVDDVMTTGASLNELAKILKKAGATHVECWVVARALQK